MDKKIYRKLQRDFGDIQELLLALGDEKRQLILMAFLKQESCEGIRVIELTEVTKLSRPAVSHHVKILKEAGILEIKREGTKNYYYLSPYMDIEIERLKDVLSDVLGILKEKE